MIYISFDWAHKALAFVELCKEHDLDAELGRAPIPYNTNIVRINDGKFTVSHCGNYSQFESCLAPILINLVKFNMLQERDKQNAKKNVKR